jgi:predicted peptidase
LPLLCFLHGYDEGAPVDIIDALTRHGPLREGNPREWIDRFVIVAPQLPVRGDLWRRYAAAVREIVLAEAWRYRCDVTRLYLTGFSFGANGVFDLALEQPDLWSAAWAVDPTRVPPRALEIPVWVSIGQASRHQASAFVRRLGLAEAMQGTDRIWIDEGADHVGTARRAYRNLRAYEWLLRQVGDEEAGKDVTE